MLEKQKHPMLVVLEATFSKSIEQDLESNYFPLVSDLKKWTCFSDYCFDDQNKPNDVVTFSLMPYIDDIEELSNYIKKVAQKDIKNSRKVTEHYTEFLSSYPLLNFSFLLNDRKRIFGQTPEDCRKTLIISFEQIRDQYLIWVVNQPEKSDHYKTVIKKIERTIEQVKQGKKMKQIVSMFLITYLGAFVSSKVVKKTELNLFGWFSDRDAIHEVSDQLSAHLFEFFLYGFSNAHQFQFATAAATSLDKPFYDELLKIPDYLAGTLADLNFETNMISKEKFDTVLTDYMADNSHNNFVLRLGSIDNELKCSRVSFYKKPTV